MKKNKDFNLIFSVFSYLLYAIIMINFVNTGANFLSTIIMGLLIIFFGAFWELSHGNC